MKLTALFILFFTLNVSANGFGQNKISIRVKKAEIAGILSSIEKQTNYRFLYNNNLQDIREKVSLNVKEATLDEVLDLMLQKTRLLYQMMENNLVVIKEDPNAPVSAPEVIVRGKVTGEGGAPLAGASVQVKGSTTGTTTDNNGNFSLTVANANVTLIVSSVGYESQEIALAGRTDVAVALTVSVRVQEQVVVIGYGTAAKRDLTGSIVKISGKDIADKPNVNPIASLQGKVAGLYVVNTGVPGAEPDIRLRGTGSLSSGGTKPLYIVDGIFNDNINYLNPNDIESIEILKDPSSLAIFGVRGANGVIAITTKKAKSGELNINFNSTVGTKTLVDKIEMVNAEEFKMLFEEEQTNLGITGSDRFDFTPWTGNTDWVNELTRTGIFNTNNLSLTTTSERNKFYLGVGHAYDEGVIKHQQLQKMFINISDELKLSSNIKIGFNVTGLRQRNPYGAANGLLFSARRTLPITPVYNNDRNAYYDLAIQAAQMNNPAMELEDNWDKELSYEHRMVASAFAEIRFLKNFTLRSTVYGDISNVDTRSYRPIDSVYSPVINSVFVHRSYQLTSVSQSNSKYNKVQQDHVLTFKKNFNDHNLTMTGGFTTYFNSYRNINGSISQSSTGQPIPDDKRFWYINTVWGDRETRQVGSGQWERATVSYLARALYNYKNKYMLNLSYRRDLSSAWRQDYDNQGDNFYSVGAAWEISREDFFSNQNIFDYLKLKASYGKLGVQNTYGFDYPAYPSLKAQYAVFGNINVPVYSEEYLAGKDLHWEQVFGQEVGIEFSMFKRKLTGDIAYYHKKTKDLLALISAGAGYLQLTNFGDMRNKGIEASLTYNQSLSKDLNLTVSGNITTFDNLFLNSPFTSNPDEQYPNRTVAGYPIGYFYGYVATGVFQTYAEKLASPAMNLGNVYGPGDLKYADINGDGVVTTDDRTMIGNPTPDFTYGGNVTLKYKNFDFGVDIQGVYGNEIYRYWGSSELPYTKFNYPKFKLNRWHGEGTSNWDPILGDDHSTNRLPSTYGVEDGSYVRIRNLQFGYNINPVALEKFKIKSFRVFVNFQNLKTWKRNSGYSPEFGGSPTSFGIDTGDNPIPAVFTGGINVNF
ncbi:MAG: SusC/RagA family TonB-linked outer membrane protein [Chitinophagaceae bacterium]|nr:SusC/RagA family TonB-linked outer membrane protein [Chitinophagaceae bacterium]